MKKSIGILMPVSALPNRFGSGDFGPDAYKFVDHIKKAGFQIWQILPLNPLGYGNSPYQPFSSFAMDEIYLSLDYLIKDGLLEEAPDYNKYEEAVDYEAAKAFRHAYLIKAFERFTPTEDYKQWVKQQKWLKSYELFMTFKEANKMRTWNEWPAAMRDYPELKQVDLKPYRSVIQYHRFIQYYLFKQWSALKEYANKKGILIMGDIPFYVGLDSGDCWGSRSNFLLDKKGRPRFIAGVPPDYFSDLGQRWGNPIYDWSFMEKDHFKFWLNRLSYNKNLFDIIRLDHFRAFDTYWKIPASCPTAIEGEWIEAPGYQFFDTLYKNYPDISIIAEDLGDLREQVDILRDHYHLRGMNVLQFTFQIDSENTVTPHSVAYTGTHDNETIAAWYQKKSPSEKRQIRNWFKQHGFTGEDLTDQFLQFALQCGADTVIIPMADWLGIGKEGTINRPGTIGSPNWEWRLPSLEPFEQKETRIREMISASR